MDKAKIYQKQKKYLGDLQKMSKSNLILKDDGSLIEYSPTQELLDEDFISKAVWECLKNNDPEGVIEIIETHLEVVNKVRLASETKLPRATMYHAFKRRNPTIRTLAKLVNCCL